MAAVDDYLGLGDQHSAAHFFSRICPQVLVARRSALKLLGGRYGFKLLGQGGGEWLLDFKTAEVRGTLDGADVYVELEVADFEKLMSDELSVADAVSSRRIRWAGRTALLGNLKYAFLPA